MQLKSSKSSLLVHLSGIFLSDKNSRSFLLTESARVEGRVIDHGQSFYNDSIRSLAQRACSEV